MRKLEKALYILLWYVTNDGLESTRRSNIAANANSMGIVKNKDGSVSWEVTAQPARTALNNEDLPWEVVCNTCPLLVKACANAGWTDKHLDILAGFFGGILTHCWRGLADPMELCLLHVYLTEQRRLWHSSLASGTRYNLSIFNDRLLKDTYERVYRQDHRVQDALARAAYTYVYSHL